MELSEVIHRVNSTLSQGFEIPLADLKPEANLFTDLNLDSLDAIDMLVHLEEKMGIRVDTEVFKEVRTVNDVYRMVHQISESSQLNH